MSIGSVAAPRGGILGTLISRLFLKSESCNNELQTGIGWKWHIAVFLACFAIVVSRRPDVIFNPQFYGEDGTIWYPQAYMSGWFHALFYSQDGYFQTFPRLAAAVALSVPFRYAPLAENLLGITIQVLPVSFLLSARVRNWAPLFVRILLSLLYLGLPNTSELDVAPVEGHWHLALLACLVVLACPAHRWGWRVFDTAAVLLSGLSGPFTILLLAIASVFVYRHRSRWRMFLVAMLAVSAAIQVYALLTVAAANRSHEPLGATPELFLQIVAGQIYLGGMFGNAAAQVARSTPELLAGGLAGTAIVACCVLKARLEWKLFIAFCGLVFSASLLAPMASKTVPQWLVLKITPGVRYWFFPILGFEWAAVWCATLAKNMTFRYIGGAALLLTCTGIAADWRYPPAPDLHFPESAARFASAAPGIMIHIPILPDGWIMRLVKRSACQGLLLGSVDHPRPGENVTASVRVAGWVAGQHAVRSVSISLDRNLIQSVAPTVRRSDIDSIYPQSRDTYKGWDITVDLSRFSPGPHELEVRASEANGCTADIYLIPINLRR